MNLPPGQRRIRDFPRFGVAGRPPIVPTEPVIEIGGAVGAPITVPVARLAELPRRELTADFHCVSGWSATGLHWEGVAFGDFYREIVEPALPADATITHVELAGLDGYRSVVTLEDALAPEVLLAEHLDGQPLGSEHGAPVRLLSPAQYGYVSIKHLCFVGLHTSEPRVRYHPHWQIHLGLQLVKPHPRARVGHEERHRYLPGRVVRPVYHRLIRHFRKANERGWSAPAGQLPGSNA
jgi:DMSO/TMAO reductase YedYZ molybdopterin-dependent catalytic subunit